MHSWCFNFEGFKSEWATVKDQQLYIGGLGKEWTSTKGEVLNINPQYVKRVSANGAVEHLDWHKHYNKMREAAGIHPPGEPDMTCQLTLINHTHQLGKMMSRLVIASVTQL